MTVPKVSKLEREYSSHAGDLKDLNIPGINVLAFARPLSV